MSYIGRGFATSSVLLWSGTTWATGAQSGVGGGGDGADPGASYVLMGTTASLANERALTAGAGIDLADGGAGSTATLSVDDSVVATISGSLFAGEVLMGANPIKSASFIEFGAQPAKTGAIRLDQGSGIYQRDKQNTKNVLLASLNSDNTVVFGTNGTAGIQFDPTGTWNVVPNVLNFLTTTSQIRATLGDFSVRATAGDLILSGNTGVQIQGDNGLVMAGASPIKSASFIEIGAQSAQSGAIRLPFRNSISARNQVDTADYSLMTLGVSNILNLGGTLGGTRPAAAILDTTGATLIQHTGVTKLTVDTDEILAASIPFKSASYIEVASTRAATSGAIRLDDVQQIVGRGNAADADINMLGFNGAGILFVGSTVGDSVAPSQTYINASTLCGFAINDTLEFWVQANVAEFRVDTVQWNTANVSPMLTATAGDLVLSGNLGIAISGSYLRLDRSPGPDPAAFANAGTMFASGSDAAGVWISGTGTETVFGLAEPECPRCEIDYVIAARNKRLGWNKELCVNCLMKQLDTLGIDRSTYMITDEGDF